MTVIFSTKSTKQNRYTINDEIVGHLFFDRGIFKTSDKDLVRKLIRHPLKKRGDFTMVTNEELVANWLEGKESDKITRAMLNVLTLQGIIELGKLARTTETQPTLIKEALIGEPITSEVREILDFYKAKRTKEEGAAVAEEKEELQEEKKVTKRGRPKKTETVKN